MFSFIVNDPASTIVVVGALLIVLILYFLGMKKKAAILTLELIDIAESLILGTKKGENRYNFVYNRIYRNLPKLIKNLYTEEQIHGMIQSAFDRYQENIEKLMDEF